MNKIKISSRSNCSSAACNYFSAVFESWELLAVFTTDQTNFGFRWSVLNYLAFLIPKMRSSRTYNESRISAKQIAGTSLNRCGKTVFCYNASGSFS